MCVGRGCLRVSTRMHRGQGLAPAKETSVYKVQIKSNKEDTPGAQATSIFVLSLSPLDILVGGAEPSQPCLDPRLPLKDFCDLWGLHHSFLEEGFCLCKGQECLWGSAQTFVPRGSLGGEAVLLMCWERLQAIH